MKKNNDKLNKAIEEDDKEALKDLIEETSKILTKIS